MLAIFNVVSFQEINNYIYIVNESNQKIYFLENKAKLIWEILVSGEYTIDKIFCEVSNKFSGYFSEEYE